MVTPSFVLAPEQTIADQQTIAQICDRAVLMRFCGLNPVTIGQELEIQHRLDRLAVAIHEGYVRSRLAEGEEIGARPAIVPWEALPETYREESRSQGDHHWIKARELGLFAVPLADAANHGVKTLECLPAAHLEALSKAEHDRWVCSRLAQGWRYSETRDDARLRHDNLVPWEQLSDAVKGYDRSAILEMPRAFEEAGLALLPLSVRPTEGLELIPDDVRRVELNAPGAPEDGADKFLFLADPEAQPADSEVLFDSFAVLCAGKGLDQRRLLEGLSDYWYSQSIRGGA
jgi:hypothetical protein